MKAKKAKDAKGATAAARKDLYDFSPQRTFRGENLDQIAFPLGGIGAGQINLGGVGDLRDFSTRHKPALGRQPLAFASLTCLQRGSAPVARVLEGPVTQSRIFNHGNLSSGTGRGYEGLPRMAAAAFRGEFPFARVEFSEPNLPVTAALEAWSPFIPLDDHNSSLPTAILTYSLRNRSRKPVEAVVGFHISDAVIMQDFGDRQYNMSRATRGRGLQGLSIKPAELTEDDLRYSTFAVATTAKDAVLKAGWFRGGWWDARTLLWKEIEAGRLTPQTASKPPMNREKPMPSGGSVAATIKIKPGQTAKVTFILAWHKPWSNAVYGWPKEEIEAAQSGCCPGGGPCDPKKNATWWQPYYAAHWKDAWAVAQHVTKNLESLESRSRRFRDVFFSTTAPWHALDAVSANLGILKSPTVLRTADGAIWGFEGCHDGEGCCYGSCTHVWNYAQAIPHLFPNLERSLRELELDLSMDTKGFVSFRSALPQRRDPAFRNFAAADGQLGGIMKVFRDWQVGGDEAWLKRMYPAARASLEYCIKAWDPKERGALFESHHNTYDIEFYGPDGMCASIYLGALNAAAAMADRQGEAGDAERWRRIAAKGRAFCSKEIYNGEFYHQKIVEKGLKSRFLDDPKHAATSPEAVRLMRKEGPKYQYGSGCLSDGVIGEWFAREYGLPPGLEPEETRSTLRSIFRHNFKADLRRHVNPQRPLYAINEEAGLLLCTWPRGGKLSLPFVYSDEVWTGIEYQVASHLIHEGMVDEGLTIVKAVRDRYEGRKRNPWNEYECGSYYARAMASYAVLNALFGFRYSAATGELSFLPRMDQPKNATFFSTAKAWGKATLARSKKSGWRLTLEVEEGVLPVKSLRIPAGKKAGKGPVTEAVIVLPAGIVAKAGEPVRFEIGE